MSVKKLPDGRFEFTVHGLSFKQNPNSPNLFAFVASANDLIKFCGVARKSHDLLTNYQRALDTRRVKDEVTPFFRTPENCSPTAVVLSLQQTNVSEIDFQQVGVDSLDENIVLNTLTLRFMDLEKTPMEEVVIFARQFLDARLSKGLPGPSTLDEVSDSEDEEEEDDEEEGDEEDEAEEEEAAEEEATDESTVEIGQSMLRQLRQKLEQPDLLSPDMIDSLRDMLKPALIIDGQHRLFGAAGVEENIPLLVCSLVQPSWKEQVFQFVVVNDKAAGIPKPFITSLAGMSLTSGELDELRVRLSDAGLKLWEVEVMQRLGYDPKSPLYNMIEFKVSSTGKIEKKEKPTGLGYQTMKKVGRYWYDGKNDALLRTMEVLYCKPGQKKMSKKQAVREWRKQDWFEFFCTFWNAFKTKFEGTPVWELHSNLLTAVVLEMIQIDFLTYLFGLGDMLYDGIDEEDDEKRRTLVMQKFRKWVDNFVSKHTKALYEKEWKATSLNHSDGRKALLALFAKVRGGKPFATDPVIKGTVG